MSERSCEEPSRTMLRSPVDLTMPPEAGFDRAHDLAWQEARRRAAEPMLLSWWDGPRGRYSPPVSCCGEDEPAWLIYARSRGADLDVSINGEQYVFLFWTGEPED
jgi:hypothetical protein